MVTNPTNYLKLFNGKAYEQLNSDQRDAVNEFCASNKPRFVTYLEKALEESSFQNENQLYEGIKMIGFRPQEIIGKVRSSLGSDHREKRTRRSRRAGGRGIDCMVQLRKLFTRRHQITHQADLYISGRKSKGMERTIKYLVAKKLVSNAKKFIEKLNIMVDK